MPHHGSQWTNCLSTIGRSVRGHNSWWMFQPMNTTLHGYRIHWTTHHGRNVRGPNIHWRNNNALFLQRLFAYFVSFKGSLSSKIKLAPKFWIPAGDSLNLMLSTWNVNNDFILKSRAPYGIDLWRKKTTAEVDYLFTVILCLISLIQHISR